MDYIIHLLILVCLYIILAQGFNLSFGLGQLFNLAHVAVYALGAYAAALLATELQVNFFLCLLASILSGGMFALLLGAISLRLAQDYFAIGTLAFSSVISALLINWKSLTRGVLGIPGIPRPEIGTIDFYQNINFLYLLLALVLITQFILWVFFRGSYARRLRCQAEYDQAALSLGFNTRRIRTISFAMSSCMGGLAGALFAYYMNYIDPSSFALGEMIFVLTIIVVGRPGSFWGVLASTVFLVLLPEPLRFIEMSPSVLGPLRQLLHAVILFAVVFINREKLFPVEREV
jgi:branched-chain amino acid transport system permease protein